MFPLGQLALGGGFTYFVLCTWNPFVLYFWVWTLQKKALSIQNKGHLGSRYIHPYVGKVIQFDLRHIFQIGNQQPVVI